MHMQTVQIYLAGARVGGKRVGARRGTRGCGKGDVARGMWQGGGMYILMKISTKQLSLHLVLLLACTLLAVTGCYRPELSNFGGFSQFWSGILRKYPIMTS